MLAWSTALFLCIAAQTPPDQLSSSRIGRRVVKSFDFDESPLGNFESTPMNWARHIGAGFPRYLQARFDRGFGHNAPPSLRLSLMGGSIGTVYEGRDIPIHPRSDYRSIAWVRPDHLKFARAYFTACYLDRAMQKIESSERRSPPIGAENDDQWHEVVIDLPGGIEDARWISLGCWILQTRSPADQPRPVRFEDMSGGAWFDDITVLRLPRTAIESPARTPRASIHAPHAGVFPSDEPFEVSLRVVDPDGSGIRAEFAVDDCDSVQRLLRTIPIAAGRDQATPVDLSALGPGWYRARLAVYAADRQLIERETALLRLAADLPGTDRAHGMMGTSLVEWSRQPWTDVHPLLHEAGVSSVKIPFWSANVTAHDVINGNPDMDRALHDLQADGAHVIAVLEQPPDALSIQYDPARRSLLDILSSPSSRWRPYLALLIARYASTVDAWQIGRDGDDALLSDPRAAAVITQIRDEAEALSHARAMAVPMGLAHPAKLDAASDAFVSLAIPPYVRPEHLPDHLAPFLQAGRKNIWTNIAPPENRNYPTRLSLADLARRIVMTRVAGAGLVFVPQPWQLEPNATISVKPEFLVVRTLSQALGGTGPAMTLPTHPGVHAWLFPRTDAGGTVLAWADSDEGPPQSIRLAVGASARGSDVLGRPVPSTEQATAGVASPDRTYALGFSPLVLADVDSAHVRLQASLRLAQSSVRAVGGNQATTILLENTLNQAIQGRLVLTAPEGWHLNRTAIPVSLAAGESGEYPLVLQLPTNVAAGPRIIRAMLTLKDVPPETIRTDLPVMVAADELNIDAWIEVDGAKVVIHHRMTNRSPQPLDLNIVVVAPGRPRMSQLIRGLAPGATSQRRFELERADELRGKNVRIGIEQAGGPLRLNLLLPVG